MSCWVLTLPYTPQGSEHYFSVKQQAQRDHSSGHRKGGLENGSTQDWEARTGRRWFQEPRAPLLQKSLLWTYRYATRWNILFWPQNTLHMTLKWIIQVCPKSIVYSLQTAQYLPHTHLLSAEMREKHVFAVVGDTLVEMQARAQQGLEQSGGRIWTVRTNFRN